MTQQVGAWVHFQGANGLLFSARTKDIDFEDCSKFMKVKGDPVTLPEGMADALEAVLVFSPGSDAPDQEAEIEFVDGVLICRTQNERGQIERRVPLETHADSEQLEALPKMQINPTFFINVLGHTTTLTLDQGRALFSTKKFKHVLNLTMLEE